MNKSWIYNVLVLKIIFFNVDGQWVKSNCISTSGITSESRCQLMCR